jgi:hypothetical protein
VKVPPDLPAHRFTHTHHKTAFLMWCEVRKEAVPVLDAPQMVHSQARGPRLDTSRYMLQQLQHQVHDEAASRLGLAGLPA